MYSVLMSVYKKEVGAFLKASVESIFNQTVPTSDFVLVCDGPLTEELELVISQMKEKYSPVLNVVRLEKNIGLGGALNHGIKFCKNELVARMDSDDISKPNRIALQLAAFEKNPQLDIVSGTIEEFVDTPENVISKRKLPQTHNEILTFAKGRCPFNHPCVMYKKSSVEAAGGYVDFHFLEDYHLWVRMLMNGCVGENIEESILLMRGGKDMYNRRGGLSYAASQLRLMNFMKKSKFINLKEYIFGVVSRVGAALLPNSIREKLYSKLMREE